MKTAGIKEGDVVKCDVRGRIFFAEVRETGVAIPRTQAKTTRTGLRIRPITANITFTVITPYEVIGHYRKAKGSR